MNFTGCLDLLPRTGRRAPPTGMDSGTDTSPCGVFGAPGGRSEDRARRGHEDRMVIPRSLTAAWILRLRGVARLGEVSLLVRKGGLEPPRCYPQASETCASTSSATFAGRVR